MQEHNLIKIFTERLNKFRVRYMISGSIASIVYGVPRVTHDIDIVLSLLVSEAIKINEIFPQEEFYCPPIDVLKIEAAKENRGHCNIIHHNSGFKADIYFAGNDEFQQWGLKNIKEIDLTGTKLPIAPIEYVIVKKMEYYQEGNSQKHLNDIRGIIENSHDEINWELLKEFIEKFGLTKEWDLLNMNKQ